MYEVVGDSLADRPISILKDANKIYIVDKSIEVGETILAKGLNKVSPGTKIKPIEKPLDSIINSFETVFK